MDLLIALQKERDAVKIKIHDLNLLWEKRTGIIKNSSLPKLIEEAKGRLEEVEVAISAIKELRKSKANGN